MGLRNTKHKPEIFHFTVSSFPVELASLDGLLPMPVVIDPDVGEEVGLYWLDRTPFVKKLASVRPFQLFLKVGVSRTDFGPLMWMLFYVPDPSGKRQPFASMEAHLNIHDESTVSVWRRLSAQTHWHLTLLGQNNVVADFFEFENVFGLADAINSAEEACRGLAMTDFIAAKRQFSEQYSMDELFRLG